MSKSVWRLFYRSRNEGGRKSKGVTHEKVSLSRNKNARCFYQLNWLIYFSFFFSWSINIQLLWEMGVYFFIWRLDSEVSSNLTCSLRNKRQCVDYLASRWIFYRFDETFPQYPKRKKNHWKSIFFFCRFSSQPWKMQVFVLRGFVQWLIKSKTNMCARLFTVKRFHVCFFCCDWYLWRWLRYCLNRVDFPASIAWKIAKVLHTNLFLDAVEDHRRMWLK